VAASTTILAVSTGTFSPHKFLPRKTNIIPSTTMATWFSLVNFRGNYDSWFETDRMMEFHIGNMKDIFRARRGSSLNLEYLFEYCSLKFQLVIFGLSGPLAFVLHPSTQSSQQNMTSLPWQRSLFDKIRHINSRISSSETEVDRLLGTWVSSLMRV
jgi:hypothetical protein